MLHQEPSQLWQTRLSTRFQSRQDLKRDQNKTVCALKQTSKKKKKGCRLVQCSIFGFSDPRISHLLSLLRKTLKWSNEPTHTVISARTCIVVNMPRTKQTFGPSPHLPTDAVQRRYKKRTSEDKLGRQATRPNRSVCCNC